MLYIRTYAHTVNVLKCKTKIFFVWVKRICTSRVKEWKSTLYKSCLNALYLLGYFRRFWAFVPIKTLNWMKWYVCYMTIYRITIEFILDIPECKLIHNSFMSKRFSTNTSSTLIRHILIRYCSVWDTECILKGDRRKIVLH